jgi:hypothetical protein
MNKAKVLSGVVAGVLGVVGLAAAGGGAGLISKPGGESLGMNVNLLVNAPFENFLIPGIILLALIGLPSLIGVHFAAKNHRFAGIYTVVLGAVLVGWMAFEVYWIGWESWLEPTMLGAGVIEMALGFVLHRLHVENRGMFTFHRHTHAH